MAGDAGDLKKVRDTPKGRPSSKAKQKASGPAKRRQKAPKNDIRRPSNSWICFRTHWDPIVRAENPGIKNGGVC